MKAKTMIGLALAVMAVGAMLYWATRTGPRTAVSRPVTTPPALREGGRFRADGEGFAACGWAAGGSTKDAIDRALASVPADRLSQADMTFVFYTTSHAPEEVARVMQARKGAHTQICAWSTDYGIVTPDGHVGSADGVIGQMTFRLDGIRVGVGGAALEEAETPGACALVAAEQAAFEAGVSLDDRPRAIIMSTTYNGHEEAFVEALTERFGPDVPVLGGTAGGNSHIGAAGSTVVANGRTIRKGLVVVAMYAGRPFAWAYRGGYDRTGKSGTITRSDGRVIWEIDGRPAVDVYDEWSGGRMREAMRAGKDMNLFTAFYPICRTIVSNDVSYNLFIHAWPPANTDDTKHMISSATVYDGDVVHFSEGSWNMLLNRVAALPRTAMEERGGFTTAAGLLVCCEGILKTIPEEQRGQIAYLINRSMGDAPWIGMFTWGEQGNVPGLGNFHGNLQASMTLLPSSSEPPR